MSELKSIEDNDFEAEVTQAGTPVLVDFWAPWCGPCKALGPKLEELSKTYEGKVKFVKMDVDKNTGTPSKFGVRGIPTLIVFNEGKMVDQVVGNQSVETIEGLLKKVL